MTDSRVTRAHQERPTAFDRLCRHLGRGVVLAGTVLLLALVLEGVARVVYEVPPVRRVYDPFSYRIPQPLLVDTFKSLDGAPVTVRLNELGMRGPSIARPVTPDTLTLVFLGGSTTENYAFPREETFPELIGSTVARRIGRPVRVFNAGMSAATSSTSLARLNHQVLDLAPSLVVVMHGINDLLAGFHPDFRRDGRHLPRPAVAGSRPRSYLLDLAGRWRAPEPVSSPLDRRVFDDYEHFAALDVFERNLRSMAAIADNRDLPILLLTQATMYQDELVSEDAARLLMADRVLGCVTVPPDIASLARGMRAFNAVTTGVGSATFDLAARVPKSEMYMYDKCHFTRAGNALVAAELSPVVETILRASPDRATR